MAEFSVLFFYTILPIMILSIPLVVVISMITAQVLRNRNYKTIIKMDNGFRLYQEQNGNILLRPRGWFTKGAFIVYGALISFVLITSLLDPSITRPNERVPTLIVTVIAIVFLVSSVVYLRYGTIYIDAQQKIVRFAQNKTLIQFSEISSLDIREDDSLLGRFIAVNPFVNRNTIVLILKNGRQVELGSVSAIMNFLGKSESKAREIINLIKAGIVQG